jgi:hypothetical protein
MPINNTIDEYFDILSQSGAFIVAYGSSTFNLAEIPLKEQIAELLLKTLST